MTTYPQYLAKTASLTDHLSPMPPLPWFRRPFALPAYHWVLIACVVTLAVHAFFSPFWITILGIGSLIAQKISLRTLKIGNSPLSRYYPFCQGIVFAGGIAGLFLWFGTSFSLGLSISLLLMCLIGKIWEIHTRRDAYVILNTNLFILASAFLWTQDIIMAAGVGIALFFVLFSFVALSDHNNPTGEGRIKSLSLITIPALPLLLVLFLFFPRISPLWAMPSTGEHAKTGIPDSMSPGDFSKLSKSTELAFRVEFEQDIPNRQELYWRTMVFSDFDGVTWRPANMRPVIWQQVGRTPDWAAPLVSTKNAKPYRILMQPNHQHWVVNLEHSRLVSVTGLATTSDYTVRSFAPVSEPINYNAHYLPNRQFNTITLSNQQRKVNLALPATGNPKSREFAQSLYQKANGDVATFVKLVQDHISNNNYHYTLSPPRLYNDRIDEFLFGTQAGFCEHYASSFVFLSRSANIPSRVVVGYQGGELGRDGKSWEVRQMDAHAWAEVWIDGQGWQRVDPTAFVAPNRIENGMDNLTESMGAQMFGEGVGATLGYQQFRLLQTLNRFSDQARYYWQRTIIDFDQSNQQNLLLQWFNIENLVQQMLVLIGTFSGLSIAMMIYFWHKRRVQYHPLDLPFIKLSNRLHDHQSGLGLLPNETILGYLTRLGQLYPATQTLTPLLSQTYRQHRFGDSPFTHTTLNQLKGQVRQLEKQILG